MDEKSARTQRPTHTDRQAFPPRTHPNLAPERGNSSESRSERGDRGYPESCNPNRTRPPLDEDQRSLAARYMPLARSLARRMTEKMPGAGDDFHSAAFLALVEAAQHFDPTRRVNFSVFARRRIWGALCDMREELFKLNKPDKTGAGPIVVRLTNHSCLNGKIVNSTPDDPVGTEMEAIDTLENWIGQLPGLQGRAFRHIYIDGKTQTEAAALVGCSKWTMSRMHSQGLTSLQRICELDLAQVPSEHGTSEPAPDGTDRDSSPE